MYEEIVTKAVIGKGKKSFRNKYEYSLSQEAINLLGCYIMNHKTNAIKENENVRINGSFDVNIWYTYDNNTKTMVDVQTINYSELIDINYKDEPKGENTEIETTYTKMPTVVEAQNIKNILKYEVEKEIEVLMLGNAKVRIKTIEEPQIDDIDKEINTDYLG